MLARTQGLQNAKRPPKAPDYDEESDANDAVQLPMKPSRSQKPAASAVVPQSSATPSGMWLIYLSSLYSTDVERNSLTVPINKSRKRTAINTSTSSGASSNESDKESSNSSSSELSDSEDDDLSRLANNAPKALVDALAKEVNILFHLDLIMTIQILYLSVRSGQMIREQLPLLKSVLLSTKN